MDAIRASVEKFGFNDPIGVWGKNNEIVEGHGRQLVAIEKGLPLVPIIHLDHMTDEARRAYGLAHSRTAELSSWDEAAKEVELKAIHNIDMSEFGFEVPDWSGEEEDEPDEFNIVRSKQFSIKPMSAQEAILQMNMLGHDFFVFRKDDADGPIAVVYRRKSSDYGLIVDDGE